MWYRNPGASLISRMYHEPLNLQILLHAGLSVCKTCLLMSLCQLVPAKTSSPLLNLNSENSLYTLFLLALPHKSPTICFSLFIVGTLVNSNFCALYIPAVSDSPLNWAPTVKNGSDLRLNWTNRWVHQHFVFRIQSLQPSWKGNGERQNGENDPNFRIKCPLPLVSLVTYWRTRCLQNP